MHLRQINEITNHRITGGSEYMWKCYPDARHLDYESDYAYISVMHNTLTQEIYEANVTVKENSASDAATKPYRWLNPEYTDAYCTESTERNIDPTVAWDTTKWVDLEVEEDFFEKAKAIFNGQEFDNRIQVPIELDNETMLALCMEAHKRDLTLNELVAEMLRNMITTKDFS